MSASRREQLLWAVMSVGLCLSIGATAATSPQVSIALLALALGVFSAAAPASAWVGASLTGALTFKGLVTLGILPSVATFMDMPLAWGALAIALLKRREINGFAKRHLRLLAIFAFVVALSWLMHPSEALRPFLYLALIGEPFAVVGALLVDPPSPRARRNLRRLLALLIGAQVLFAVLELARFGPSDHIQGTLYGAGAGAHTMSAVVLVGAFWAFSSKTGGIAWQRFAIVAPMLAIPFLADAKQVLFASPAMLLVGNWRGQVRAYAARAILVGVVLVSLIYFYPAGRTAMGFIRQSESGQGGKQAAGAFIWNKVSSDPQSLVFGKGPAETVSRAAFMTTDMLQAEDSPLRVLGLKPASIALEAQNRAIAESHGGTSFNTGLSSALGILGDLGLAGIAAYAALYGSLFIALRRLRSPEAVAAAGGWAMWAVLGLVFDWWEQPPFSLVLAVLSGLALTAGQRCTSAVRPT
jgi:hypothetical protein